MMSMSKKEEKKLFQPILPLQLSTIFEHAYNTAYTKIEEFHINVEEKTSKFHSSCFNQLEKFNEGPVIEFSASVETTDSFCVVFESADDDEDVGEGWKDGDEDTEDDEEDSDSDEEEDQILNYSLRKGSTNDLFEDTEDEGEDVVDYCFQPQLVKKRSIKTVSFMDDEHLVSVIEFEDDIESQSCRQNYWEMLARDNSRFKNRIFRTGDILTPILESGHRDKVFQDRFAAESSETNKSL